LQKGVILAAAGIAAGVVFAASGPATMASLLYGVRPRDPEVFLVVPLVLLFVALMASYIPALRAAKVDPMIALREV
jgi:putative ABC transport system permease protein